MWFRRTVLSCRDIQILRLGKNFVAKIVAQEPRGVEVDFSEEQGAQLVLHGEEIQSGRLTRLEFDEDVHVAICPEIIAQHGAEQSKPANVVAPAELSDSVLRNIKLASVL